MIRFLGFGMGYFRTQKEHPRRGAQRVLRWGSMRSQIGGVNAPSDSLYGLYYYGYRFYDPVTGRWPSRDPIGERGALHLYAFTFNQPTNAIDDTGLSVIFPGGSGTPSTGVNPLPSPESDDDSVPQPPEASSLDDHGYYRSLEAREWTRDSIQGDRGPFSRNEYCGLICCKDGEYKSTPPHSGPKAKMKWFPGHGWVRQNQSSCDPTFDYATESIVSCPWVFGEGWKAVGIYHSHTMSPDFSQSDKDLAKLADLPYFLGTPKGDVKKTDGTDEGTEPVPPPGVPDLPDIPVNPAQEVWPKIPIR